MDFLLRGCLWYMADITFDNPSHLKSYLNVTDNNVYSYLNAFLNVVTFLTPSDIIHLLINAVYLVFLGLPYKTMCGIYKFSYLFTALNVNYQCYPYYQAETYGVFLQISVILLSAYLFKLIHNESEVSTSMCATVLLLSSLKNISIPLFLTNYALIAVLAVITFPGIPDLTHSICKSFIFKIGAYWLVLVSQPLQWLQPHRWNIWNGVIVQGLATSSRLFGLSAVLALVNYRLFNQLRKLFFANLGSNSWKYSFKSSKHFLILAMEEQIWIWVPDKRAELVLNLLLTHFSFTLLSFYDILRIPLFTHNPRNDVEKRQDRKNALIVFLVITISSLILLYFGCSTFILNRYLSIILTNIFYLALRIILDAWRFVINNFRPIHDLHLAHSRRVLSLLDDANEFLMKSLMAAYWMRSLYYQGVALIRLCTVMEYFLCDLIPAISSIVMQIKPWYYVRTLPTVNKEQLTRENGNCLVCYERMEAARVTPCQHHYHADCLLTWLRKNNTCPLCRKVLFYALTMPEFD